MFRKIKYKINVNLTRIGQKLDKVINRHPYFSFGIGLSFIIIGLWNIFKVGAKWVFV